jgi:hypothetical protein
MMEVVIMLTGFQVVNGNILARFVAMGKFSNGQTFENLAFEVPWVAGASAASVRTAVQNAGKQAFENTFGITVPASPTVEIYGTNKL